MTNQSEISEYKSIDVQYVLFIILWLGVYLNPALTEDKQKMA